MAQRDSQAKLKQLAQGARFDDDVLDALVQRGYDTPSALADAILTDVSFEPGIKSILLNNEGLRQSRGIDDSNMVTASLAGKMRRLLRDSRAIVSASTGSTPPAQVRLAAGTKSSHQS